MSTVVLYCWCHSDSASVLLYFTFNHVQIQCYAVMKIILKEFIKVRCSPQNRVLCSYFIKTFLFWKFDVTESTFWRPDNFHNCISLLLVEFTKCIRDGELPHYFFPKFNLLSVKLTREAQRELLKLLETAIEHNIAILNECNTLRKVWSQFIKSDLNIKHLTHIMIKRNIIRNDLCMIAHADLSYYLYSNLIGVSNRSSLNPSRVTRVIRQLATGILAGQYATSLAPLVPRYYIFCSKIPHRNPGNRDVYFFRHLALNDASSVDISTFKLWYAMVLLMRTDYAASLSTVHDVLSSIPPFALYTSGNLLQSSSESKSLYEHVKLQSDADVIERAKTSWLQDLHFHKNMLYNIQLPLAIDIELSFCDKRVGVDVSPFIFAYYLMFLCHHELRQYDDRDRALRRLVDNVTNPQQHGYIYYHAPNIAAHCLLLVGQKDRARRFFIASYKFTRKHPPHHKYNSALHYLKRAPW